MSVILLKGLCVERSLKACTEEGKGEEDASQTVLRECSKIERRQRARVTVFLGPTNFTVHSVVSSCSIGVQIKTKNLKTSICPLFLKEKEVYFWVEEILVR